MPDPEGNPASTLTLLVVVLLAPVTVLVVGAVAYAVHRCPSLNARVTAGITTVTALAAVLSLVIAAGGGGA